MFPYQDTAAAYNQEESKTSKELCGQSGFVETSTGGMNGRLEWAGALIYNERFLSNLQVQEHPPRCLPSARVLL